MITPRTLQGFSDYLPDEMPYRQYLIDTWREIFKKYGYGQLETPALEYADVLLGKYGEEEKLIYHFKDHGDRHIALRYDQTVPLARVVAEHYNDLTFPFKRFEINRVWRAEAARKGRKREFYQCDIDVLGTSSLLAEAEVMAVMDEGFRTLNLPKTVIHINHRQILNSFVKGLKIPEEKHIEVTRSIDKFDKVGLNGVEDELKSRQVPSDSIPKILEFISHQDKDHQRMLKKIGEMIGDDENGQKGLDDLKKLLTYLEVFDLESDRYQISLSLVRGLDYYTGVVFEAMALDSGYGSIGGGGRYDNLCGLFSPHTISGVGVGLGFERMYSILQEQKLFPEHIGGTQVLVTIFNEETAADSLKIAQLLRENGISTSVYFQADKLGKQFQYADKLNIPYVLILGPDEVKKGVVMVKDMKRGEQKEVGIDKILNFEF